MNRQTIEALPLAAAARQLGKSPGTLRRWIRSGCPALAGGRGHGKGSRVDLAAVRAWRDRKAPSSDAQLRDLAAVMLDFYRRGMEPDAPGQRVLGISNPKAAAFLCFLWQYAARRLKAELTAPEIELLAEIARQGNDHGMVDLK